VSIAVGHICAREYHCCDNRDIPIFNNETIYLKNISISGLFWQLKIAIMFHVIFINKNDERASLL
jgi:hypothetical protein